MRKRKGIIAAFLIVALIIVSVILAFRPVEEAPPSPLSLTLDKTTYHRNERMTITIKNLSDNTFTFSNSTYDMHIERWVDGNWVSHSGVIGDDIITGLHLGESGQVILNANFLPGKYRAKSTGISDGENTVIVDAYAEFTIL